MHKEPTSKIMFDKYLKASLECISRNGDELGQSAAIIQEGLTPLQAIKDPTAKHLNDLLAVIKSAKENFEVTDKSFEKLYAEFSQEMKTTDAPAIDFKEIRKKINEEMGHLAIQGVICTDPNIFPQDLRLEMRALNAIGASKLNAESFKKLSEMTRGFGPPKITYKNDGSGEFTDNYAVRGVLNTINNSLDKVRKQLRAAAPVVPAPALQFMPPPPKPKPHNVPKAFCNPDGSPMKDPVVINDEGISVDRQFVPANAKYLIPNRKMKDAIEAIQSGNVDEIQNSFRDMLFNISTMSEPVIDNYGYTYDKAEILRFHSQPGKANFCVGNNTNYQGPAKLIPNKTYLAGMREYYRAQPRNAPMTFNSNS